MNCEYQGECQLKCFDEADCFVKSLFNQICTLEKQLKHLKQKNEKQKKQIKQLEDFIKSDGEIDHINHEYTYKLRTCLQEIKKYIAKICKEECGYVQKKRCPDCDCRFGAILDLITKAEEE